ncbi:YmfQ family protein [Roseospira navarrensis]|uniref:DUF2313 domain-containing protein n=1 Tax=Roseospira navarrensis TaxID=140058 RepID=A0A7X1ZEG4_9PROT|nr:putative phage tail protein [Roseospira navarrensis]MQX36807.1 DUF2313 domain-containing protein [Roseospira navarrensis]
MARDAAAYRRVLAGLLPRGAAWRRDPGSVLGRLLEALGAPLARADARADALVDEADPRTTWEMLADWERVCGLPDTCSRAAGTPTLEERRAAVVQRLTARGGQSRAFFLGIAEALGYAITIEEWRPFQVGLSGVGPSVDPGMLGPQLGPPQIRFVWRVTVLEPRVTRFHVGTSQCGVDQLTAIRRAEDLECQFRRRAPAHTHLIFRYEGV